MKHCTKAPRLECQDKCKMYEDRENCFWYRDCDSCIRDCDKTNCDGHMTAFQAKIKSISIKSDFRKRY